jgi:hypothetical protein
MKIEKQRNEKGKAMSNIEYPMLNVEVKYTNSGDLYWAYSLLCRLAEGREGVRLPRRGLPIADCRLPILSRPL